MPSDNPGPRIAAAGLVALFGGLAILLAAAGLWFLAIGPAAAALMWCRDVLRNDDDA